MSTPAAILRQAAGYIREHGWCQGAYYDASKPGVSAPAACTEAAIWSVVTGVPGFDPDSDEAYEGAILLEFIDAEQALMEFLREWATVAAWNDVTDRTSARHDGP